MNALHKGKGESNFGELVNTIERECTLAKVEDMEISLRKELATDSESRKLKSELRNSIKTANEYFDSLSGGNVSVFYPPCFVPHLISCTITKDCINFGTCFCRTLTEL